jgi:hypothetical protein
MKKMINVISSIFREKLQQKAHILAIPPVYFILARLSYCKIIFLYPYAGLIDRYAREEHMVFDICHCHIFYNGIDLFLAQDEKLT